MNKISIFILAIITLGSCSNSINSDNEKPLIENLVINNLDSDVDVIFPTGDNIRFSANFIDNQELGSYRFDIHFAGDGHKHSHYKPKKALSVKEWNFTKNNNIAGTEQKISFDKKISVSDASNVDAVATAGPYHCVVYCVDEAGNASDFVYAKFIVTNPDMPVYTITDPDFTDYTVAAGGVIPLKGIARGVKGLSKLAYIIRSVDDPDLDDVLFESEIVEGNVKEVDMDYPITIPSDAKAGNYALILLASDKLGNVGEHLELFKITN